MNNIINKIVSAVILSAGLYIAGGCTNLDETIYSQIATEQYHFTNKDAEAMFSPVYSSLRSVLWDWNGLPDLTDECSDLWFIPYRVGVGWGDYYVPLHQHAFSVSGIEHLQNLWERAYAGVNACNKLMADEAVKSSETSMNQLKGFRALYYYILFDNFRNIPLDTTYVHPDGWTPTQATPQQTWDFIISELNSIKGKCGDNGFGTINDATVNMILAKMYLNHEAWFRDGDMSYYGKAIDEVNEIIAMNKYSLAPTYHENFVDDISSSPEVIFGVPYEYNYAGGNYWAHLWMNEAGRATWGFTGWATGGGGCITQFLDSYDEDDQRLTDTWIWGPQKNQAGEQIFAGTDSLIYTRYLHTIEHCFYMEGARMVKYQIYGGSRGTAYDDVPFFRYADALMIKAECLLRLGGYKGESEQVAADLVSQVRTRDFSSNPEKARRTVEQLKGGSVYDYGVREIISPSEAPNSDNPSGHGDWFYANLTRNETHEGGDDIYLGGLLDELGWEFVGEYHRRQDLIRFTLVGRESGPNRVPVFNAKSWFSKRAETDLSDHHKEVFPIHEAVMNGNHNLVQNEGY